MLWKKLFKNIYSIKYSTFFAKLCQYNKILRKRQTKITAINTNQLELQKNWNLKILKSTFIKKNKSKIVYKIVQKHSSRCVIQERIPTNTKQIAGEQQYRSSISTKLLCNFIEITPMHRQATENLQHIHRTTPPGEHLWGIASAAKKNSKRLKL